MEITSSVVFELLKRTFQLTELETSVNNLPVTAPQLLSEDPRPGILYLCKGNEAAAFVPKDGCAYLILSAQVPDGLTRSRASIAVIRDEISPVQLLYRVFEIMEELQHWDLSLKDISYNSHNLEKLLAAGQQLFPYPMSLVDRAFNIVACTPDQTFDFLPERRAGEVKVPDEVVNSLFREQDFNELDLIHGIFTYPLAVPEAKRLCCNIYSNEQYLGRLMADVPFGGTPGSRYLFGHLIGYLTEAYLNSANDILVRRQTDRLHRLIRQMLSPEEAVEEPRIRRTLVPYNWQMDHRYQLIVIRQASHFSPGHTLPYVGRQLEREWPDSCVMISENQIIWLVNLNLSRFLPDTNSFPSAFVSLLQDFGCQSGSSSVFTLQPSLAEYYQQAEVTLKYAGKAPGDPRCARFTDYVLDYSFELLPSLISREDFCHPGLRQLLAEDAAAGSELVKTLYFFLACHFNASLAAEKCYVHRSTFIRQMKRVREVTGIDWSGSVDPDTLLWVLASFRYLQISF